MKGSPMYRNYGAPFTKPDGKTDKMESLPAKEVVTSERAEKKASQHASNVKGFAENMMKNDGGGGFINYKMLNNPKLWTKEGKLIRGVDSTMDQYIAKPGDDTRGSESTQDLLNLESYDEFIAREQREEAQNAK